MYNGNGKTLVMQHGTLIDGSGRPATTNEAIVIEGNRIRSVGRLPEDVRLEDQDHVQVIDATEHWIMPGLIDGHCHLSFGFPQMAKVLPCCVLPFLVSVWYPQALSHTPSRERGNA